VGSYDDTCSDAADDASTASSTQTQSRPCAGDLRRGRPDRVYGSIFGFAMVGGEIVWLCLLAYIAYRLFV
jgi:hypothetical protein